MTIKLHIRTSECKQAEMHVLYLNSITLMLFFSLYLSIYLYTYKTLIILID